MKSQSMPRPVPGDVADFSIHGGRFNGYRVRVFRDRDGYRAKLISPGIGTIMEPGGYDTPAAALKALVNELWTFNFQTGDRQLAKEIAKYAWFPLRVGE